MLAVEEVGDVLVRAGELRDDVRRRCASADFPLQAAELVVVVGGKHLDADRIGVAVPAVIASQFALIAAVVGWLVLGERLGRRQLVGAGAILAGVTALTILQA